MPIPPGRQRTRPTPGRNDGVSKRTYGVRRLDQRTDWLPARRADARERQHSTFARPVRLTLPFIGRLHQTRPATGHNATAHPTQFLSQVANRAKHPCSRGMRANPKIVTRNSARFFGRSRCKIIDHLPQSLHGLPENLDNLRLIVETYRLAGIRESSRTAIFCLITLYPILRQNNLPGFFMTSGPTPSPPSNVTSTNIHELLDSMAQSSPYDSTSLRQERAAPSHSKCRLHTRRSCGRWRTCLSRRHSRSLYASMHPGRRTDPQPPSA